MDPGLRRGDEETGRGDEESHYFSAEKAVG
jgi:hypothetical protein